MDAKDTGLKPYVILCVCVLGCGGELTTPTGSFVSPNYPYPYGHDAECFLLITTNQGSTLILTFADFDLETHGTCAFDFLKVRRA